MRMLTNQDAEGEERQITENWGSIPEETRLRFLGWHQVRSLPNPVTGKY